MFQLRTAVNPDSLYADGTCIAESEAMTFLEFVIVYLACGAPFAVEHLLCSAAGSSAFKGLSATAHLVIWPVDLILKLSRVINFNFVSPLNSPITNKTTFSPSSSASKRRELSCLMSDAATDQNLGRFNELLERYSGLARLRLDISDSSTHTIPEVAQVTGHPEPRTAAACYNRRNAAAVGRHLLGARDEFLRLLRGLSADSPEPETMLLLALDFTSDFDPEAVKLISLMMREQFEAEASSERESVDRSRFDRRAVVDEPF